MVCIAAFIILLIIWLFTPLLKLFGKKKLANDIGKLFKKSIYCFSRRVTFRACDSSFKDDIKDSILSRLIIRHKKLVKPVSFGIEASALIIVLVTVVSALTVVKSGLALYVYGTCNVKTPASCALSATQACSIDNFEKSNPVRDWFSDWGEIFGAIPSRVKTWTAEDYKPKYGKYINQGLDTKVNPSQTAIDIFDPGCIVCRKSFTKQLDSGFFNKYKTYVIPYVISGPNGDKFKNSRIVSSYLIASNRIEQKSNKYTAETAILINLFTKKDENGTNYQDLFNTSYSKDDAIKKVELWLITDAGFNESDISKTRTLVKDNTIKKQIENNKELVESKIKTKRIPTMIYDGKRHEGLFSIK